MGNPSGYWGMREVWRTLGVGKVRVFMIGDRKATVIRRLSGLIVGGRVVVKARYIKCGDGAGR